MSNYQREQANHIVELIRIINGLQTDLDKANKRIEELEKAPTEAATRPNLIPNAPGSACAGIPMLDMGVSVDAEGRVHYNGNKVGVGMKMPPKATKEPALRRYHEGRIAELERQVARIAIVLGLGRQQGKAGLVSQLTSLETRLSWIEEMLSAPVRAEAEEGEPDTNE